MRYEPDIVRILAESQDDKEMEYYWTEFRAATGDKMRALYLEYVDLTNQAARYLSFVFTDLNFCNWLIFIEKNCLLNFPE